MRDLVPPLLLRALRGRHRSFATVDEQIRFAGDYGTWDGAARDSDGYDIPAILERVRASTGKVRDGLAVYERDGVTFDRVEYPFPLLACLLHVATVGRNRLRVLDFGGALGSTYFQCRSFFNGLDELRWNVVEQSHFVDCGRREFQNENLRYYSDIGECLAIGPVDVVLLSSVLPYLEKPYEWLESIVARRLPFLIIDRTPLLPGRHDRLTVQSVPAYIYGKPVRYPAWMLARETIFTLLKEDYTVLAEFIGIAGEISLPGALATDTGLFLKLTSGPPSIQQEQGAKEHE